MNTNNNQNFIDYETMKKIHEHALLYESAYDKKDFLRNISPYEQKIILMNSSKPYDILEYLDELDLKGTRLLLEELSFDEIKHIINLFSSEDKKKFYATFSDLALVNQFITHDKNSSEHVENLSFERKVDLMDSSDKETEVATSVIYESMAVDERVTASEKLTDADASYTLESTNVYSDTQEQVETNEEVEQQATVEEVHIEPIEEGQTQTEQEEQTLEGSQEDVTVQQQATQPLQSQENPNLLNAGYNLNEEPYEITEENDLTILEQFQQEKNKCEQVVILNLVNQTLQKNSDVINKTY